MKQRKTTLIDTWCLEHFVLPQLVQHSISIIYSVESISPLQKFRKIFLTRQNFDIFLFWYRFQLFVHKLLQIRYSFRILLNIRLSNIKY